MVIDNGKRVLYMELLRAIYGCIQSALMWYALYANTLKDMGFEINSYDKCIASRMINGNQCKIVWYVNDNKISQQRRKSCQRYTNNIQRNILGLTITQLNSHDFLGMNLTITKEKSVEISIRKKIEEVNGIFGE